MLIKSLSSIGQRTFISNNLISLYYNYNKKTMSTIKNIVDGLTDVKCRMKVAIQKRNQVFVYC